MKRILFLGTNNFPFGMAEVAKQTLIARALQEQNCEVCFVCNKAYNSQNIRYKGSSDGISYIYTCLTTQRLKNRFFNKVVWTWGLFIERLYLLFARYDAAIVNSRSYEEIKTYASIFHFRKKKLFLTHTEDLRSMYPNPTRKKEKEINAFETKTWHIVDGVFPISDELIRQVKTQNPNLPILKIPVLVDHTEAEQALYNNDMDAPYVMFGGSADYFDTINYIISGFERTRVPVKLLLVASGSEKSLNRVVGRVEASSAKKRIVLKNYLPKEELWGYYTHAIALLIPLNFDQRDKARFPHKIGEYCASKVPIITSNWGEIPNYFTHKENALLLRSNDPVELSDAIDFLYIHPNEKERLAENSYLLACNEFNYKTYGNKLITFII